jgi:hypothetical protein
LFEPLIKNLVRKLDVAAVAYLERQQLINLMAVPGTLMFLLLFWAFSGAGGLMLVLGLFVIALEVGIAIGLFLLKDRYEDQVLDWIGAADAIEGHLTGGDVFGEWTEFLQTPSRDPELESIRSLCQELPDEYPPKAVGEYCGPDGVALMHECIERLRVGIVSRAYEDFQVWWDARQDAKHGLDGPVRRTKKKRKKKKTKATGETRKTKKKAKLTGKRKLGRPSAGEADAVMRVASMSGGILDRDEQRRIDQEADQESVRAGKEDRRNAKRDARRARKATRKAMKIEKKLRIRAAMMEAVEDEMILYQDEELEDSVPQRRAAPMQRPHDPHADAYEDEEEEQQEYEQEEYEDEQEPEEDEQPAHHKQLRQQPPPPEPAPKQRRQRGLTEAAALQEVMRSGLTAHHYDDAQVRLTEQLGRFPKPREVLKALKAQSSKKSRKHAKQKKARRPSPSNKAMRPMAAFRIDSGPAVQGHKQLRPAGNARTVARVILVLGLIAGAPFAAWRVPRPETTPITISGKVHHRVLDHAPDIQHELRTPFEELFGYKPVNLVDGERIYVNDEDYKKCWPESWDAIYSGRYSVVITAEVTQLLFGGHSVARVTSAERVDLPVATTTEYTLEAPEAPQQWQPVRRIRRPRLRH